MKTLVLYNPLSNNNKSGKIPDVIKKIALDGELVFFDITKIEDLSEFIGNIEKGNKVIIAGGDGTLNFVANQCENLSSDVYFYPCGNGNDFARDVKALGELIPLCEYVKNLPVCIINKEERKFINGVGIGFDGYVCSKVNEARLKKGKDSNYIAIALKGVIGGYRRTNATIEVDGKKKRYKGVWLCAAMKGKYYGGGFMMAPEQDRLCMSGDVSLVVVHSAPILKVLYAFLLVFKGKHTILKKSVEIIRGHNIKVEFDTSAPLQIDGETYQNVKSFGVEKSVVVV